MPNATVMRSRNRFARCSLTVADAAWGETGNSCWDIVIPGLPRLGRGRGHGAVAASTLYPCWGPVVAAVATEGTRRVGVGQPGVPPIPRTSEPAADSADAAPEARPGVAARRAGHARRR